MEDDFIGFGRHEDGTFDIKYEGDTHYCKKCKRDLPKDMFYFNGYRRKKDNKMSLSNICKNCIVPSNANISIKQFILYRLKSRAKQKGLEFNLDESDIIIPQVCPVFGFELKQNEQAVRDNSISVDRIDNTKGYIKGNIQIMSNLANSMKKNASVEQLIMFANWVLKQYQTE